ncbi:MAG: hypothetical protein IPN70_02005 [Candidatus Moraniibacteriota bacterium]|nr:MAG: hypothetical protein IPN70_02005 [Candidatus Moranbacteria bacterium]
MNFFRKQKEERVIRPSLDSVVGKRNAFISPTVLLSKISTVPFFERNKKLLLGSFFLIAVSAFTLTFFYYAETIKAATFSWLQSSWSQQSTDTAQHPGSQTGWASYESSTGITAGSDIRLIREDL